MDLSGTTEVADITDEADVEAIFRDLTLVDHIFISAGRAIEGEGRILETDLDTLHSDVDQHLWGPLFVVRHAAPKMKQGSITFLSGQYGSRPEAGAVLPSALCSAIETLAKGLALELAPIRVNAIAPGLIDTPLLGTFREEGSGWAAKTLPVKRMGLAEEVGQAVLFVMTNGFMTGEVIHIDGGGRLV